MEPGTIAQIAAFTLFSLIAIAGALGMATTMSMFRSGIFLMASFIGVAGLFVLLLADLIGMLQVMMYIGGMLVMILFMVLFSHDPGGSMMTGMMELPPVEKFFSLGLKHGGERAEHEEHAGRKHGGEGGEKNDGDGGHDMDMSQMSMTTPIKKQAAWIAAAVGTLFLGLILFRPAWPVRQQLPAPDSAREIGHLLMSKYMIAFEGAGLLILLGIFGALLMSRPGMYPDAEDRDRLEAAVDAHPAPVEEEHFEPAYNREPDEPKGERHAEHEHHGGHR